MMKKFKKWFTAGSDTAFELPEGPLDVLSPAFIADPYPFYAALRKDKPLAELASGGYLLTRHADIQSAFTNPDLGNGPSRFSALAPKNKDKYTAASIAAHIPPFLDMPEHKLPRQALSRAFFSVFKEKEAMFRSLAVDMVNDVHGEVDLISSLSSPYSLKGMADFVGLDASLDQLKAITHAFFHLFAPISDAAQFKQTNVQLDKARALISASVLARKSAPTTDLISALLEHQAADPDLSDEQIVDLALLVFADGIENIEAGIASVFQVISTQSQVFNGRYEDAVREALRLNTPGQIIPRVAKEDVTLHGQSIGAGTPVFLALASGNRDDTVFENADMFELDRGAAPITFGLGRHRCIGEQLAMVQITAMTHALCDANASLVATDSEPDYHARFGHRWPMSLGISLPAKV